MLCDGILLLMLLAANAAGAAGAAVSISLCVAYDRGHYATQYILSGYLFTYFYTYVCAYHVMCLASIYPTLLLLSTWVAVGSQQQASRKAAC